MKTSKVVAFGIIFGVFTIGLLVLGLLFGMNKDEAVEVFSKTLAVIGVFTGLVLAVMALERLVAQK